MRVADFIAKRLKFLGLTDVFMVTGGAAMHLNDAFADAFSSNVHCLHHEQSCAMAAESYARVKGKPGLVNVTAGPGAINAINGVFGSYVDSIPIIVVSGQAKRETMISNYEDKELRQLGDQEVDIVNMVQGVCKYTKVVRDPLKIDEIVNDAYYTAISGRPGPTWIDVPIDVQAYPLPDSYSSKIEDINIKIQVQLGDKTPVAQDDILEKLALKILSSNRPVIYAGNGIRLSESYEQFLEFIEDWKISTVTAWNSNDLLWDSHPCYSGRPGTVGNRAGNFAVQYSDCVITIGSRLNIRLVSFNWKSFAKNAWKCHIDIDKSELEKPTLNTDLKINATIKDFFPRLSKKMKAVTEKNNISSRSSKWVKWREFNKKYLEIYAPHKEALKPIKDTVNPYRLVHQLSQNLNENDIVVCADGTACVVGFQAAEIKKGQRWFHNSGCASMGYELPAAIGAFYASGKEIICLAGDGSIMMNLQEMAYIGGLKLPIKIILLNNKGYHSIRQTQNNYFPNNPVGCGIESGLPFPNFEKLCEGFKVDYLKLQDESNMKNRVDSLLSANGPTLLEITVNLEQQFSPKLASKKLSDGSMVTAELEDMTPLLGDEVMNKIRAEAESIN